VAPPVVAPPVVAPPVVAPPGGKPKGEAKVQAGVLASVAAKSSTSGLKKLAETR
jgi:hypothetical protein